MKFTLVFCMLLLTWLSPAHAENIQLDDSVTSHTLHDSIGKLEDKKGIVNYKAVLKGQSLAGLFSYQEGDYFSLGFTESVYWFRFSVNNPYPETRTRLFVVRTAWLDNVELYYPGDGGLFQKKSMGDKLPFASRDIPHHHLIASLEIPPGFSYYLVRVETPKPLLTPMFLWEPTAFYRFEWTYAAYFGVIFGSLFVMLLYNGIIYFSIRDKRYLYYCLYLITFFIMNFTYNGFSFQYLWPEATSWTAWSYSLWIYLFQIAGLVFAKSFLSTRKRMPRFHIVILVYISFLVAAPVYTYLTNNELLYNKLAVYSVFLYSPLIAVAGIMALLSEFRAARFFVIASLASLIGAFFTALTVAGFLAYSFIGYHAVEFGLLANMILLSLAMADRINLMNIEREVAQQKAMDRELDANRTLQQAKYDLEKMVDHRTAELMVAKENAERLARLDELTGVANRRSFEEQASTEYKRSRRHDHHLAVIIFDLDNFKEINDTHGHSTGDAVIQSAAKLTREVIRDIDTVGRLGGEEFAILLPETTLNEGIEIAERIRQKILDSSVAIFNGEIKYTASFGVARLEPEHESLEAALRNADAAMYMAKQGGRNRVMSWE